LAVEEHSTPSGSGDHNCHPLASLHPTTTTTTTTSGIRCHWCCLLRDDAFHLHHKIVVQALCALALARGPPVTTTAVPIPALLLLPILRRMMHGMQLLCKALLGPTSAGTRLVRIRCCSAAAAAGHTPPSQTSQTTHPCKV
jgi:hypothetical protein